MTHTGLPPRQGLYDPWYEHDACGVGFIVDLKGRKSNTLVQQGIQILLNLEHRGASGCEANTGDGAGILIQTPDRFLRRVTAPLGITLPPLGQYGAGFVFFPRAIAEREQIRRHIARIVGEEGQILLGWRPVPTDDRLLGASAVAAEPVFEQLFIGAGPDIASPGSDAAARFERKLYVIRKRI